MCVLIFIKQRRRERASHPKLSRLPTKTGENKKKHTHHPRYVAAAAARRVTSLSQIQTTGSTRPSRHHTKYVDIYKRKTTTKGALKKHRAMCPNCLVAWRALEEKGKIARATLAGGSRGFLFSYAWCHLRTKSRVLHLCSAAML